MFERVEELARPRVKFGDRLRFHCRLQDMRACRRRRRRRLDGVWRADRACASCQWTQDCCHRTSGVRRTLFKPEPDDFVVGLVEVEESSLVEGG